MGNFCYSFPETLTNEAAVDSDSSSHSLDEEQEGFSSSEESAANKPVAKKRRNTFVEDKEEEVKHKSVSVFIHLILSLSECTYCVQD
jgi:hypothetical protein